ncbi:MAG TPA: hypothetical protein VG099_12295, partial [Gemmataceae bacterium]|nr:hypothetical protein [Gemmataceae bacterium]
GQASPGKGFSVNDHILVSNSVLPTHMRKNGRLPSRFFITIRMHAPRGFSISNAMPALTMDAALLLANLPIRS